MTETSPIQSRSLVKTRSSMLPLLCVDCRISWDKLLSNTKSQNKVERDEQPERQNQSISGRLKSPKIITRSLLDKSDKNVSKLEK